MLSDRDIVFAMGIALVLLVIATCVWPGFARVRGRDLAGYWLSSSSDRALYEIRDLGGRAFAVKRQGSLPVAEGRAQRIRAIDIPALSKKGSLEFGSRHINWSDGDIWVRQGVLV